MSLGKYEDHEEYWDSQRDADKKLYHLIIAHLREVGEDTIVSIARKLGSNNCSVERVVDYHRRSFRTEIIESRCNRRGTLVELNPCLKNHERKMPCRK